MHRKRVKIGLSIFLVLITVFIISFYYISNIIPESKSLIINNEASLKVSLPLDIYIKGRDDSELFINNQKIGQDSIRFDFREPLTILAKETGITTVEFKLFNLIPIRTVEINILPEIEVMPGGQAIGVLMRSKGVMVVKNSYVETVSGQKKFPAQKAGIEVGDIILKVNEQQINDKILLSEKINKYGEQEKKISLTIKKKNSEINEIEVKPQINKYGQYQIGLYVDDGVAGVGTLTFYNPQTLEYGALGHVITEANSQMKINLREGQIVEAQISGINYGRRGVPGQKQGTFYQAQDKLGLIEKNTKFGIYGKLNKLPSNPFFEEAIPVATSSQVQKGPAKIYTVVKGGEIEEFEISIERVNIQGQPDSKGMVINITDSDLKKSTGGIVQGMSGSPIIQNGQLVGAVTHVFINDPTKGYGVFAEWMLRETEIMDNYRQKKAVNF